MKKSIKSIVVTLVTCLTLSMIPCTTLAAEPESASLPKNWDEIEYTKTHEAAISTDTDSLNDTQRIQEALNQALTQDDDVLTVVTVPQGEYTLDWCLYIYSNTRLILEDGTVLKRSDNYQGGEMLEAGIDAATTGAVGGYDDIHNIFIEGGTWDANKNLASTDYSNIIAIMHGENIVLKSITITNSVNHMINVSGTNKVLIDGCTFEDSQVYTGDDEKFYDSGTTEADKIARNLPIEAIHLDFMNAAGESGVLDGTPCKNITITNCTFNNVFRGIGTHHTISSDPNDREYATDYGNMFRIENNTFNNVRSTCISGYSFKDMIIKNNTATNIGTFCLLIDSHESLISGNNISGTVKPASFENYCDILSPIYMESSSDITISGNTIVSDEKVHSNIMITTSSSNISIDSNTLSDATTTCIYVTDSSNIVINNISEEKRNVYSTNGDNELYATNSSVTVGYEKFNKNICITETSATIENCTLDGGYILLAKAHETSVKNTTIDTKGEDITACVLVMDCDENVTISDNTLKTTGKYCVYVSRITGHDVKISGNTFLKASKDLVYVDNSDTVTISGNLMDKTEASYERAVNTTKSNVNISNNAISNYTTTAIVINNETTATVDGNTASGGTNAFQSFNNSNVTVSNNTFKNTSSYPIEVLDSTGTFEKNTVSGGPYGMKFVGCKNLTINKNTISNTVEHGMYLYNVNTATISNNTFNNIPLYSYRVRVHEKTCVNITITPESDKEQVTPTPTIPTNNPSTNPTNNPTNKPTNNPTNKPTNNPTNKPTTPPTQAPTQAPTKEVTFEDFVERLYVVALERDSEPEGKAYWCEKVKDGTYDGAYCARFFLTSPEFMGKNKTDGEFVDTLYRTFFGREADDEGRAFWVKVIKDSSKEAVVEGFINSEEWCNICASYGVKSGAQWAKASVASKNATDFASRLYTKCLGREAEEGGLKYWSLALTNLEITGSQAARQFFYSDEFKGFNTSNEVYVIRMYETFMGREPEGDGKAYWIDYLNNGGSRDEMFNFFSTCPEFTEICASYSIER